MAEYVSAIPKVAIVGRPNVGKSSLFNRIIKARKAIVYRETGTTRDRISQEASFEAKRFIVTDTGGFAAEDKDRIMKLVKEQIRKAIKESDTLLFVCDGQTGPMPEDFELAAALRKSDKKIFLVVNKADNERMREGTLDFYQIGLDRPYAVSALHNIGVEELLEDVTKGFLTPASQEKEAEPIKVAIVGRPNVGKSSFLNALLKEDRVIVDQIPGTTRDTVDTYLKKGPTGYILIDTAGLRHKRKVKEAVDIYSIMRTKEAIKRSDACLVLVDGYDGLVVDDLKILEMVLDEGKCCILCVNKWDLVGGLSQEKYTAMIYERAVFLKRYPILFTSTKTGYNIYKALGLIKEVVDNSSVKIPTPRLNKLLTPSMLKGFKVKYITQTKIRPPTFLIFVNETKSVREDNRNFIENLMRANFNFLGAPLRFEFRGQKKVPRHLVKEEGDSGRFSK